MTETPHFDLPLRLDPRTGHLAEVEQDTIEDYAACIEAVLRTNLGERDDLPNFGIVPPELSRQPIDIEALAQQVVASEPRAAVLIEQDPEAFEDAVARLRVTVGAGGA